MRMKLLAASMLALTFATAGGAFAQTMTPPNPQSHDPALSLDSEVPWQAPTHRQAVPQRDMSTTGSIRPGTPIHTTAQGGIADAERDDCKAESNLTQSNGCD
ncbi:hypothetical protein [Rhizobium binxianense]